MNTRRRGFRVVGLELGSSNNMQLCLCEPFAIMFGLPTNMHRTARFALLHLLWLLFDALYTLA